MNIKYASAQVDNSNITDTYIYSGILHQFSESEATFSLVEDMKMQFRCNLAACRLPHSSASEHCYTPTYIPRHIYTCMRKHIHICVCVLPMHILVTFNGSVKNAQA